MFLGRSRVGYCVMKSEVSRLEWDGSHCVFFSLPSIVFFGVYFSFIQTSSYFVAGGFAFIKEGSICEISTPEVAPVSDIDLEAVRKLLAQVRS